MSDDSKQPKETRRRPMADPRLSREREPVTAMAQAAMFAGWVAALLVVVVLFWLAVTRKFAPGPKVLLAAAIVLGIFWGYAYWEKLKGAAAGRGVRVATNSAVFSVFVLGILVLLNVIGARHHWRKDLTEAKLYSLSEQTREVAKALKQEVGMFAFMSPEYISQYGPELKDRLREYEVLSPKLKVETYDPKTNTAKVKEYDIKMDGTILIKSGDREEKVTGGDEEQITSAILAVTSGEKTKVYFLTGHGELSYEATGQDAMGNIKATLENQQYELKTLNLLTQKSPAVPADCAVLVIAGPKEPLRQEEIKAISSYAGQGGKLLVALEPNGPDLAELLEPHGIKPRAGTIIDPQAGWFGDPLVPLTVKMGRHQITEPLGRVAVALPTARALEVLESEEPAEPEYPGAPPPPPTQKGTPLLETSADAWLETSTAGQVQKDPGELGGPLVMAAAVDEGRQQQEQMPGMPPMPEEDENALRMVVIGDADMMTDAVMRFQLQGNAYFVLNSVNWLLENEKLISIPPKQEMPKYLTMSSPQLKFATVLTAVIVPLLVLVSGVVVWWRRR